MWVGFAEADEIDLRSVVGQMQNPTYGFGDRVGGGGDDASLKSGWSGETLGAEKSGARKGSLVKRLFRRKGFEGKGGEEKGKSDDGSS